MQRWLPALLVFSLAGCGLDSFDHQDFTHTGVDALSHLSLCDQDALPASMTDVWVYDGGTFNGMIYYVSFQCETLEDCWQAVEAFRAPGKLRFALGVQTRFAVNQHGPSFYYPEMQHPQWDLANIRDGVSYEKWDSDRTMDFWAIDRQRLRVYFHHESGGFPNDPPSVRHR